MRVKSRNARRSLRTSRRRPAQNKLRRMVVETLETRRVLTSASFFESFEVDQLSDLSAWTITPDEDGFVRLDANSLADSGQTGLRFGFQGDVTRQITNRADTVLDMTSVASATDLSLEFSVHRYHASSANNLEVHASGNGVQWRRISGTLRDTPGQWLQYTIDLDQTLSAYNIARDSDVHLRFQHRSQSIGEELAIDTVRVGTAALTVDLVPTAVQEGDDTIYPLTVTRPTTSDQATELQVALVTLPNDELDVPDSITIPAGQASASVDVRVLDDAVVDGRQNIVIVARAGDFSPGYDRVAVDDNEPRELQITLDMATVSESVGPDAVSLQLYRNRDTGTEQTVVLSSTDSTELILPESVVFPAGHSYTYATAATQNDYELDGDQLVNVVGTIGALQTQIGVLVQDDDAADDRTLGGRFAGVLPASDYRATFDVSISTDESLQLLPGTRIEFDNASGLVVDGTLRAIGTGQMPIVLTSSASEKMPGDWSGVEFNGAFQERSTLEHIEVAYAEYGIRLPSTSRPSLTVSQSTIHHSSVYGVQLSAGPSDAIEPGDVSIADSRIHDNGFSGVRISASASTTRGSSRNAASVFRNEIYDNGAAGIEISAGYSASTGGTPRSGRATPTVDSNVLYGNTNGITVYAGHNGLFGSASAQPVIRNNLLHNHSSDAIRVSRGQRGSVSGFIAHNTIVDNDGAGISHQANVGPTMVNNLITGNQFGIESFSEYTPAAGQVGFNNVYGNGSNWQNYPASFGQPSQTNLVGLPADDEMNIDEPSQFLAGSDFRLQRSSPEINSGTGVNTLLPTEDIDGQQRAGAPDIGFDEVWFLAISLDHSEVSENFGQLGMQLARVNTTIDHDLTVRLNSDGGADLLLPDEVTIPAGQSVIQFSGTVVDNDLLDGPRNVAITGSAENHLAALSNLVINDHELLSLEADSTQINEGSKTTVTLTRSNTDMSQPLTVALNAAEKFNLDFPATVTIPANSPSTTFDVTALEDNNVTGNRLVSLVAESAGYVLGRLTLLSVE